MATRREEEHGNFDHGAVAFRAGHPLFIEHVAEWEKWSLVAPWRPVQVGLVRGREPHRQDPAERWVGTPRMSELTRNMAENLDFHCRHRVAALHPAGDHWQLLDGTGELCRDGDEAVTGFERGRHAAGFDEREEDGLAEHLADDEREHE